VTLRAVARWGDACNIVGDPETVRHKLEVLKYHCEEVGRDYEEIITSTGVTVQLVEKEGDASGAEAASTRGSATYAGTPEMVAEELQALVDAGIAYFISHHTAQRLRPRGTNPIRARGRADVHPMSVSLSIKPLTGCAQTMGDDSPDGALYLVDSRLRIFKPEPKPSQDACATLVHEPWGWEGLARPS
jgi:hypothetical protein